MKKNLILIISLLVFLVLIGVIFSDSKMEKEISKTTESIAENVDGVIVPGSFGLRVLSLSDDYVKTDIKYPYFLSANKDFNIKIKNTVKIAAIEHKKMSKENWQARFLTQQEGDNIPSFPQGDDEKFYFFSDFKIAQSNSSYISFVLSYGGFLGGAHEYENKVSFAYDVKNQKIIELKDIFPNNSDYLLNISVKSREFLVNEYATISEEEKDGSSKDAIDAYINNIISAINEGTIPTEENFSTFTFTPDKIKIYFAQYQVGPYSLGAPEVEIDR